MNELDDFLLEPERYELDEATPLSSFDRRGFLRLVGAGVVVATLLNEAEAQPPGRRRGGGGGAQPRELGAWIHVAEDSSVTVFTGKVEVGQNVRTSLTQVVAEELRTAPERITLVMADTDRTPFDGGTAGSRTTPGMVPQLRRVAAAAREMLLDLAVAESKLERTALTLSEGKITIQGDASFTFGQLTKGKKLVQVIDDRAPMTPLDKCTLIGKSIPKVDGRSFVTGAHQYTSDVKRPGMLMGKVLRPPSYGARLVSVKTAEAEKIPGVIVTRSGDFVGVVAPTEHQAQKALDAIEAEWRTTPQISNAELFAQLKKAPRGGGGGRGGRGGGGNRGSIAAGLKAADKTLEATYEISYIAHVPLEPRAAVAEWESDKLTVWTGTQMPFRVRGELASALGVSADNVRVIVPDTGSGYGGKHSGEAAVEAARLAKAARKPVKLVWTREEEFTWAYFRPAGVIEIKSGVKNDGTITAWEFHNHNSGASGIACPYDVANQLVEFHSATAPLRQGSYRALASPVNCFARESHVDDLAALIGMEPLAFRLKSLRDRRLRAVLEAAAKAFGWGTAKPVEGRGHGIACGTEKGGYTATCAEVFVDRKSGNVRVERLLTAFECGAIINPDHLTSQIEGCMMMCLGGALFEEVRFKDGKISNPRFSDYRVPRFRDLPKLETILMPRNDLSSAGAGETPMMGVAPAIGNALFQATGVRIRSLPMVPRGLKLG